MVLKTRKDIQFWEVDDEAVVYEPDKGLGHVLNSTAMHIWQLCDGRHSATDIESELLTAFPDKSDIIKVDVTRTITQFEELGLFEAAG